MEKEKLMDEFNISEEQNVALSEKYKTYEAFVKCAKSGEGVIGNSNYLSLWEKSDIEQLNDAYETTEFLNDIMLIGSDGGDIAYGINTKGEYIEVPFIGMSNEAVKIVAENFDDFIVYVASK